MRELPVTLALSLLVHAAALGGYAAMDPSESLRSVKTPAPTVEVIAPVEVAEPVLPDAPPVEVALLDDHTLAQFQDAAAPVASTKAAKVTRRETAMVATTTATTELATTEPTTGTKPTEPTTSTGTKPSKLSMRAKKEPEFHRPGSDGISDEMLKAMVDGKIPVKIANLPGAQANADFEKAQARLGNAKWVHNATGEELTAARLDRAAARQAKEQVELVAQKDGTHRSEKTTFTAKVNRDGTVDFEDKKNLQSESLLGARFDVTDAFMRDHGSDPYASAKREYLDRTRDQRIEIGKRYRTEQLGQSAQLMAQNLARLWASTTDPAKRKSELFALWDECAETGDEELVFGGTQARRLVINWIHAKRVAFTTAELAAFNARKQSKATFAP